MTLATIVENAMVLVDLNALYCNGVSISMHDGLVGKGLVLCWKTTCSVCSQQARRLDKARSFETVRDEKHFPVLEFYKKFKSKVAPTVFHFHKVRGFTIDTFRRAETKIS